MRYEVLTNYFGQHVEVAIINKNFSGILRQAESDNGLNDVVEVEPATDYARKRYGSAILDVETITSIRAIKPHTDEDDDCCDEGV
jgi:hypothetical protein